MYVSVPPFEILLVFVALLRVGCSLLLFLLYLFNFLLPLLAVFFVLIILSDFICFCLDFVTRLAFFDLPLWEKIARIHIPIAFEIHSPFASLTFDCSSVRVKFFYIFLFIPVFGLVAYFRLIQMVSVRVFIVVLLSFALSLWLFEAITIASILSFFIHLTALFSQSTDENPNFSHHLSATFLVSVFVDFLASSINCTIVFFGFNFDVLKLFLDFWYREYSILRFTLRSSQVGLFCQK